MWQFVPWLNEAYPTIYQTIFLHILAPEAFLDIALLVSISVIGCGSIEPIEMSYLLQDAGVSCAVWFNINSSSPVGGQVR